MNAPFNHLSAAQISSFHTDGFLVVPGWLDDGRLHRLQDIAVEQLQQAMPPLEFEYETGYPGAPEAIDDQGGRTPRRLLGAYQREAAWRQLATEARLVSHLKQLFSCEEIFLSQAHHNCLMTKSPRYSSDTGWHQDNRYWSFKENHLISAWFALGHEHKENGGLQLIPGSHRQRFAAEQFDDRLFFKDDSAINQQWIRQAQTLELNAGDLLFFHCNLLHCASRNQTQNTKLSLVFTYYCGENSPVAQTRSASQTPILL